ncbi:ABC transporter substrate-binding protein [Solidesulfovibrio sp.]|uniref:ABC transporter substrate-binding protein n=1 Tax=Solidesulfovibrio sp. TaxID=2910990 RepID=UPI002623198F|nr:ABC transporter substrate-binding protein [Solidesulfovibrio sp.]
MRFRFLPFFHALPVLALVMACCLPGQARAATFADADGVAVAVPDAPRRVYALSPPEALLVYAINPCLLAGWNFPQTEAARAWYPACARDLPVLGGFFGQGLTPDKEALLKAAPDLVIGGTMAPVNKEFEALFASLGIPVVRIGSRDLDDYPKALRQFGELLGDKARGEALAAYAEKTLADVRQGVAKIPRDKRLRVYYAEGEDGLSTDGQGSFHTQVLELAGGLNVHRAPPSRIFGMDKVTMETVIGYAPQVIVAQTPKVRAAILSSPTWQVIPAARDGRVLGLQARPVNWFDRPPSFMRLLSLKWMAQALYPDVFAYDMVKETREFFKLFWDKDLTEAEARTLLEPAAAAKP